MIKPSLLVTAKDSPLALTVHKNLAMVQRSVLAAISQRLLAPNSSLLNCLAIWKMTNATNELPSGYGAMDEE